MTINITIEHVTINVADSGGKGIHVDATPGATLGTLDMELLETLERALGDMDSELLAKAASMVEAHRRDVNKPHKPDPVFQIEIRDGDSIYLHGTGPELPRLLQPSLSKLVADDAMTAPNIRRVLNAHVDEIRELGFTGARLVKTAPGFQGGDPIGTWGDVKG